MKPKLFRLLFAGAVACSAQSGPTFSVVDLTPQGNGSGKSLVAGAAAGTVSGFVSGQNTSAIHGFLWPDGGAPADIHPAFLDLSDPTLTAGGNSVVLGNDLTQQVGYGYGAATYSPSWGVRHVAIRWSGTAASGEVLGVPFQVGDAHALGACNGSQVGWGMTLVPVNGRGTIRFAAGPLHAILWTTGSTLGTDLHNGATATVAAACSGTRQVGYGGTLAEVGPGFPTPIDAKAMMWSGNRNSFIWLHPPSGYAYSQALAIAGNFQAGRAAVRFRTANGKDAFSQRAVLWTGTPTSMVELAPPVGSNYAGYTATGVSSQGHVVGTGYDVTIGGTAHALYWDNPGTPAIDLNSFLPADAVNVEANGIDDLGRIIGTASYGGATHSVMWVRN